MQRGTERGAGVCLQCCYRCAAALLLSDSGLGAASNFARAKFNFCILLDFKLQQHTNEAHHHIHHATEHTIAQVLLTSDAAFLKWSNSKIWAS